MKKMIAFAFVFVSLPGISRAQEDARAIITKAIKAQGGEEKLAKIKAGKSKFKGTLQADGAAISFTGEEMFNLPSQTKVTMTIKTAPQNRSLVEVFDGDKGWIKVDGQVKDAGADDVARMKQQAYINRIILLAPLLKEKEFEMSTTKETKVNNRALVGVTVASKDQKDVTLYFDKETGLLSRLKYLTKDNRGREVTQEDEFSDYEEIGGVKVPKKTVAIQDGKKLMEVEVTQAEFPESIPAKEFSKP